MSNSDRKHLETCNLYDKSSMTRFCDCGANEQPQSPATKKCEHGVEGNCLTCYNERINPAPKDKGVKRYIHTSVYHYEKDDGDWVKWADHEAALKAKDEQIKQLEENLFKCQGFLLEADKKLAEYDSGMAQNNAVQHIAMENEELRKKLDKARDGLKEIETLTDSSTIKHLAESTLKEIE
jgi:hypothetical protein